MLIENGPAPKTGRSVEKYDIRYPVIKKVVDARTYNPRLATI